jgi:hypothetical protein
MDTVEVGTLKPDAVFRTKLTRRIGVVLLERQAGGVLVYLEPLKGRDMFEEKVLSRCIVVDVDDPVAMTAEAALAEVA